MGFLDTAGLTQLWAKITGKLDTKADKRLDQHTYTGIIATANNTTAGTFYYAKVIPDDYYKAWTIKVRYHVKINEASTHADKDKYNGVYDFEFACSGGSVARYRSVNNFYSTSYKPIYYHTVMRANQTGINAGYAHYMGVSLYSANAPTTTTLKRDFEIEILEAENCTVEMLDEMILQSDFGYSTTYYAGRSDYNAYVNASYHTGDANSIDRLCYGSFAPKAADVSLYGTQLVLSADGENFHSITNTRNTSLTLSTKTVNQYPFRPEHIFYYSGSGTVTSGNRVATSTIYESLPVTFTYSYKGSALTIHKPIYLVATYDSETTMYTPVESGWVTQDVPTEADGLYYILLGYAYATTAIYLKPIHPVYKHDGTRFRQTYPEIEEVIENGSY